MRAHLLRRSAPGAAVYLVAGTCRWGPRWPDRCRTRSDSGTSTTGWRRLRSVFAIPTLGRVGPLGLLSDEDQLDVPRPVIVRSS